MGTSHRKIYSENNCIWGSRFCGQAERAYQMRGDEGGGNWRTGLYGRKKTFSWDGKNEERLSKPLPGHFIRTQSSNRLFGGTLWSTMGDTKPRGMADYDTIALSWEQQNPSMAPSSCFKIAVSCNVMVFGLLIIPKQERREKN